MKTTKRAILSAAKKEHARAYFEYMREYEMWNAAQDRGEFGRLDEFQARIQEKREAYAATMKKVNQIRQTRAADLAQ